MHDQVFARDKDSHGINGLLTKRRRKDIRKGLDRAWLKARSQFWIVKFKIKGNENAKYNIKDPTF